MGDPLLDRLRHLAEEAQRKGATALSQEQAAYWRGVLFGLETAIAEIEANRQRH